MGPRIFTPLTLHGAQQVPLYEGISIFPREEFADLVPIDRTIEPSRVQFAARHSRRKILTANINVTTGIAANFYLGMIALRAIHSHGDILHRTTPTSRQCEREIERDRARVWYNSIKSLRPRRVPLRRAKLQRDVATAPSSRSEAHGKN